MVAPADRTAPVASAMGVLRLIAVGCVIALVLVLSLDRLTHVPPPASLRTVSDAEVLVSDADRPPPATAGWRPIALPAKVPASRSQPLSVWLRLDVPDGLDLEALPNIMVKRPYATVVIYVDGRLLTDSGTRRDPLPQFRYDLRYNLPSVMFERGARPEVHLRFIKEQGDLALEPLWFAPAAEMQAYKRGRNAVEKPWQHTMAFLLATMALVYAALWATRRAETHYLWFALALAMWALHILIGLPNAPRLGSGAFWWPVSWISLGWFVIACYFFANRYWPQPQPGLERLVLAGGMVGTATILLTAQSNLGWHPAFANRAWLPAVLGVGALLLGRMIRATAGQPFAQGDTWLPIVALVLLLVGIRDYLYDLGLFPVGTDYVRYFPLCAPLVIVGFGSVLFRRYTEAISGIEALNRELELRVEEKSLALADGWRRLTESETQRARLAERERLMREMHDGIGGQLVQAMALVEAPGGGDSESLREVLQSCLDDLRLILDSSDPSSDSLSDGLAQFRVRMAPRLARIGLDLDWPWQDMPELPRVEPGQALQLLRILQELVTNTVKHARARRIRVRFSLRRAGSGGSCGTLAMDYADDGRGIPPGDSHEGRGLPGIRARVASIAGRWFLLRPAAGFACQVLLPLEPARHATPAPEASAPDRNRTATSGPPAEPCSEAVQQSAGGDPPPAPRHAERRQP